MRVSEHWGEFSFLLKAILLNFKFVEYKFFEYEQNLLDFRPCEQKMVEFARIRHTHYFFEHSGSWKYFLFQACAFLASMAERIMLCIDCVCVCVCLWTSKFRTKGREGCSSVFWCSSCMNEAGWCVCDLAKVFYFFYSALKMLVRVRNSVIFEVFGVKFSAKKSVFQNCLFGSPYGLVFQGNLGGSIHRERRWPN